MNMKTYSETKWTTRTQLFKTGDELEKQIKLAQETERRQTKQKHNTDNYKDEQHGHRHKNHGKTQALSKGLSNSNI